VYELTYEEYVKEPARYHREIAQFIGTHIPEEGLERLSAARSKKYLDRWCKLLTNSACRNYYRYLRERTSRGLPNSAIRSRKAWSRRRKYAAGNANSPLRFVFCIIFGQICALFYRFAGEAKTSPKQLIKALLPRFILVRIWRIQLKQVVKNAKRLQLRDA
jgi:hypothetical protein